MVKIIESQYTLAGTTNRGINEIQEANSQAQTVEQPSPDIHAREDPETEELQGIDAVPLPIRNEPSIAASPRARNNQS